MGIATIFERTEHAWESRLREKDDEPGFHPLNLKGSWDAAEISSWPVNKQI